MDKVSYALGMSIGQNLVNSGIKTLEIDDFVRGVKSFLDKTVPEISAEEGNEVLGKFFTEINKEREKMEKELLAEAKKASELYLQSNAKQDGVEVTKSGLQYRIINRAEDHNVTPTAHSRVKCHYEGKLITGDVFDSSYQRGEPVVFSLEQVIPGWTEGLQLMSVGDKYEFTISPELAYGERGVPGHIPGNSVLIFTVELLEIL